jgi:hypothetical protein
VQQPQVYTSYHTVPVVTVEQPKVATVQVPIAAPQMVTVAAPQAVAVAAPQAVAVAAPQMVAVAAPQHFVQTGYQIEWALGQAPSPPASPALAAAPPPVSPMPKQEPDPPVPLMEEVAAHARPARGGARPGPAPRPRCECASRIRRGRGMTAAPRRAAGEGGAPGGEARGQQPDRAGGRGGARLIAAAPPASRLRASRGLEGCLSAVSHQTGRMRYRNRRVQSVAATEMGGSPCPGGTRPSRFRPRCSVSAGQDNARTVCRCHAPHPYELR